jgi:hypothetical protein
MAGSRLLAQIVLLLASIVLICGGFYTMRLYRYFYDRDHIISSILAQEVDWRNFLPSPIVPVVISAQDISQSTSTFQLTEFATKKYLKDQELHHLSLSDEIHYFYDPEAKFPFQSIGNQSSLQLIEEFWETTLQLSRSLNSIPPSRSFHLNLILGAESETIPPQTERVIREVAFQVLERFKSIHQSLPVSVSLRVMRNLHLKSLLKRSGPCSTLSSNEIASSSLLAKISSLGLIGTGADGLSCDPHTELCTPFFFLFYLPEPADQPLALTDSKSCPKEQATNSTVSQSFAFPSKRIGIIAFNDKSLGAVGVQVIEQRLAQQLLDQLNSHFVRDLSPPLARPFQLTSSLWSRRALLVSWASILYSDTLQQLAILQSLHSNTGLMSLSIDSGSYFPLDDERRRVLNDLQDHLKIFERCSRNDPLLSPTFFDDQLSCAYREISSANLLVKQLLSDPSLVHERREGVEMISALLLPFWFPIMIPLVYGTFFEIRRYLRKTRARAERKDGS